MPDWTKKNLDVLRDVSPPAVHVQWRFAREALRSPELGVSRFTHEPGARMPWGHRHRLQEEACIEVGGSGRAKLDDEFVELSAWDVLRVAPAVVRSFEAGPEGLDMICIGGRKPKGGDTERFEDVLELTGGTSRRPSFPFVACCDRSMEGGSVDELLDVTVERPVLDQLQVKVGRILEDRVQPGLTGDHREERHLQAVD